MSMYDPWDSDSPTIRRKYHGKYKGFVRDNADPENRGRIRVFCPQVMGPGDSAELWLHWAECCQPWLGGLTLAESGPPMTKDQAGEEVGVWIEFEDGDPDFPIWVGTFRIAPTPQEGTVDLSSAPGATGGSLLNNPPSGSNVGEINPPQPKPNTKELRFIAPEGVDIVILSKNGGSIILGKSGVMIQGLHVFVNGRSVDANLGIVSG